MQNIYQFPFCIPWRKDILQSPDINFPSHLQSLFNRTLERLTIQRPKACIYLRQKERGTLKYHYFRNGKNCKIMWIENVRLHMALETLMILTPEHDLSQEQIDDRISYSPLEGATHSYRLPFMYPVSSMYAHLFCVIIITHDQGMQVSSVLELFSYPVRYYFLPVSLLITDKNIVS